MAKLYALREPDLTPTQQRGLELMGMIVPIINGEEANAVAAALSVTLGAMVAKFCNTEEEAVKLCSQISGDITRHALDFMCDGHHDV